jgi:hypothetical protein
MTIYKTASNGYCIEKRLNDYFFKRFYIGYSLAESKSLFRQDYNQQKNKEWTRWKNTIKTTTY